MFYWLWPARPDARRALAVGFVLAVILAATEGVTFGLVMLIPVLLVALAAQYGSRPLPKS